MDIHDLLSSVKDPFIECARRFGKTTSVLTYVTDQLRKYPGWICRWCEPWKNQCREIVIPEMDNIQRSAEEMDKFVYKAIDSVYSHPNGSKIYIRGVNEDRGESSRGPKANIIVADEFGSWRDPDYIVNEALRPQLLTTNGQFIFTSTPAPDLAHLYYRYKEKAIREKRFIQKTIYDNQTLSLEKIEEIANEVGGKDKAAFRREYLCEAVADPERLVCPEFSEALHVYDDYPTPDFFDGYVGVDLGFNDFTAFIFGYFDFLNTTLVIQDELVFQSKNSLEIVTAAKAKELEIWGTKKPYLRISDNELQQLWDMNTLFKYELYPTKKDDKQAAINNLRERFSRGKIKISRKCENLIFQLKTGLWNEQRTNYTRSTNTGHLDSVDALIYLNRNVNVTKNPIPANLGVRPETHHINRLEPTMSDEEKNLKNIFTIHSKLL